MIILYVNILPNYKNGTMIINFEDDFDTYKYVEGEHILQVGSQDEKAAFISYDRMGKRVCKVVLNEYKTGVFRNALEIEDGYICVGAVAKEDYLFPRELEGIIVCFGQKGEVQWMKTYSGYVNIIEDIKKDNESLYIAGLLYNDYQDEREYGFAGNQGIGRALTILKVGLKGEIIRAVRETQRLIWPTERIWLYYNISGFEIFQNRLIVCGYQESRIDIEKAPYFISWDLELEDKRIKPIFDNEINEKYVYTDLQVSKDKIYISGDTIDSRGNIKDGFVLSINKDWNLQNIGWLKTDALDRIYAIKVASNGDVLVKGYSESFREYEGYIDESKEKGTMTYSVFDSKLNLIESQGCNKLRNILILDNVIGFVYDGALWNGILNQMDTQNTYNTLVYRWIYMLLFLGIPLVIREIIMNIWLLLIPWRRKYIYEKDKKCIRRNIEKK